MCCSYIQEFESIYYSEADIHILKVIKQKPRRNGVRIKLL